MSRSVLAALAVAVFIVVASAHAQTGDGSLRGYVKDEQGAVLPGVTVTATGPALLAPVAGVTDSGGYYRLLNLPPGTYTIAAELSGFATSRREGIIMRAGTTFTVDVQMKVGTLSETITVTGDSPKLIGKLSYLANGLASGDFKPTNQQLEVEQLIEGQLTELRAQVEGLRSRIASGFNDQLRNRNLPIIVVPPPK